MPVWVGLNRWHPETEGTRRVKGWFRIQHEGARTEARAPFARGEPPGQGCPGETTSSSPAEGLLPCLCCPGLAQGLAHTAAILV